MATYWVLEKSHFVHLKEEGEICNRLNRGIRVQLIRRKGDWFHITWRNGKKKGWIFLPEMVEVGF